MRILESHNCKVAAISTPASGIIHNIGNGLVNMDVERKGTSSSFVKVGFSSSSKCKSWNGKMHTTSSWRMARSPICMVAANPVTTTVSSLDFQTNVFTKEKITLAGQDEVFFGFLFLGGNGREEAFLFPFSS